jgi:cytochrome c biogenesis protein CcdA
VNSLLMGGTLAAAFAAGMVAFFAPCCAGVMLPAYLGAVGGGHRFRVARLTAVYVAGVALVVLPITLGVAALASTISRWHPEMFTVGGLMMIGVAVMLWRGSMLPITVHQPRLSGSISSVFALGVFSGAATACCAPVLAGAAALSAVSMSLAGGLLLGVAYVAGMMLPLIPVALIYGRAKQRLRDPKVTLRLGSHQKRIGVARLGGMVIFAGFGALFIALALTGNSENAPGFQVVMGDWMRHVGHYVALVPNVISLPILAALIGAFVYAVIKRGSRPDQPQRPHATATTEGQPSAPESDHPAVTLGPEQRSLT